MPDEPALERPRPASRQPHRSRACAPPLDDARSAHCRPRAARASAPWPAHGATRMMARPRSPAAAAAGRHQRHDRRQRRRRQGQGRPKSSATSSSSRTRAAARWSRPGRAGEGGKLVAKDETRHRPGPLRGRLHARLDRSVHADGRTDIIGPAGGPPHHGPRTGSAGPEHASPRSTTMRKENTMRIHHLHRRRPRRADRHRHRAGAAPGPAAAQPEFRRRPMDDAPPPPRGPRTPWRPWRARPDGRHGAEGRPGRRASPAAAAFEGSAFPAREGRPEARRQMRR